MNCEKCGGALIDTSAAKASADGLGFGIVISYECTDGCLAQRPLADDEIAVNRANLVVRLRRMARLERHGKTAVQAADELELLQAERDEAWAREDRA